jgi:hypothetical protein
MRRLALVGSLLLGLAGCSLTIDPNSVPPPVAGCVPVCNATLTCGVTLNNCNTTCAAGSGCTAPTTSGVRVEGRLTLGAAHASGSAHQVEGSLSSGAGQDLQGTTYRIEQGTLR